MIKAMDVASPVAAAPPGCCCIAVDAAGVVPLASIPVEVVAMLGSGAGTVVVVANGWKGAAVVEE